MEWTTIEEKLPEICEGVLITDGKEIVTACRIKPLGEGDISWTCSGFGGWDWDWDVDTDEITHWMPLPDLPKKEGAEK